MTVAVDRGGRQESYSYQLTYDRNMMSLLAMVCAVQSTFANRGVPERHTVVHSLTVDYDKVGPIEISNMSSNMSLMPFVDDLAGPMELLLFNDFARAKPVKITASVKISKGSRVAQIIQARPDKPEYRPGETARINVTFQEFQGGRFAETYDVPLAADLDDGPYLVTLAGGRNALMADRMGRPHLYRPRDLGALVAMIRRIAGFRQDRVYLYLNERRMGLGVGTHTLSDLPSTAFVRLDAADPDLAMKFPEQRAYEFPATHCIVGLLRTRLQVSRQGR